MAFPIKVCVVCSEEFELKPGKPGFANRCPQCSSPESNTSDSTDPATKRHMDADERKTVKEANEARRQAMRELLYRKDR
jgi:predicted amidophosphoribosyltransferase